MFVTKATLERKLMEQEDSLSTRYFTQNQHLLTRIKNLELRVASVEDRYLMLLDYLRLETVYPDKYPKPYLKDRV